MTLNITDAELHEWANMRADDAGRLARELVACRLQSQAAVAAAYEAAAQVVLGSNLGLDISDIADDVRALATPGQIAALAAERATTVTVKPLVWAKHPSADIWRCDTMIGTYKVFGGMPSWDFDSATDAKDKTSNTSTSAKLAQAAAQADYDARIRSAITITSGTDSAKMHKAVEALRESVLAIQYLDERAPSGTTPPTLAKITAVLAEIGGA